MSNPLTCLIFFNVSSSVAFFIFMLIVWANKDFEVPKKTTKNIHEMTILVLIAIYC